MKPLRLGAQALSVALVVALLALLIWKVSGQIGKQTIAAEVRKGHTPAEPSFALPRLDRAGVLDSASLAGKPQVINFWASWCVPCRVEAPLLARAAREWRSRGLVVIGVDHQDFTGDARSFMRRYGMSYPVVRDRGDHLYDRYGATGVPESFFVNSAGKVVAHVPGAVDGAALAEGIRKALS
jgi:cytochrome c biogenesis protein CcmG/thiol:disulfide interchange protein DsbE